MNENSIPIYYKTADLVCTRMVEFIFGVELGLHNVSETCISFEDFCITFEDVEESPYWALGRYTF